MTMRIYEVLKYKYQYTTKEIEELEVEMSEKQIELLVAGRL